MTDRLTDAELDELDEGKGAMEAKAAGRMNDMTPDPRDRPLEYLPADAVLWPSRTTDRLTDTELDWLADLFGHREDVPALVAEVREHRARKPQAIIHGPAWFFGAIETIDTQVVIKSSCTFGFPKLRWWQVRRWWRLFGEFRRHLGYRLDPDLSRLTVRSSVQLPPMTFGNGERRAARTLSDEDASWCEMVGDDARAFPLPTGGIAAAFRDHLLSALAIIDRITEEAEA